MVAMYPKIVRTIDLLVFVFCGFAYRCVQVDTEMDLPLAMERPNVETVTPYSIAISFFAPRPTLPKMKIQTFLMQVGRAARFGGNYCGFVCNNSLDY